MLGVIATTAYPSLMAIIVAPAPPGVVALQVVLLVCDGLVAAVLMTASARALMAYLAPAQAQGAAA